MKQIVVTAALMLAVLAVPQFAHAQAKAGDKEVKIAGNLFSTLAGDSNITSGNFIFGIGYFMSDRVQISVEPLFSITSAPELTFDSRGIPTGTENSVSADMGLSTRIIRYMGESSSKVKPYFGGSYIVSSFKEAADSSFAAANFGVKSYLSEKAAFDFSGSYGFLLSDPGSSSLLQVAVGITYIF